MSIKSKEIILLRYPTGLPTMADFALREVVIDNDLPPGAALIKNLYMSVDPYMRGRMSGKRTYANPFALNEPLTGGAIGQVMKSHRPDLPEGALISSFLGWREYFVVAPGKNDFVKLPAHDDIAPSCYLGVLGMVGLTAYVGLLHMAELKEGQRVFVSGAAGAVGSLVGQIAKIKNCYVVGSCGSDEKAALLRDKLGYDHVINYKKAPIARQLAEVAGEGFDVYFDNVGGDHLEAALDHMRNFGHIAMCGAISQYNLAESQPGPRNMMNIVSGRLTLRGFIVGDHEAVRQDFLGDMVNWLKAGRIHYHETTVQGIDQATKAFLGLFAGENTGKMVVKF